MRYCGRCGAPRENKEGRCPECNAVEYGILPTITFKGWQRRNHKIKTTKIIITGAESFWDEKLLTRKLNSICRKLQDVFVYTGGHRGVDKMAGDWAFRRWCSYSSWYPKIENTKMNRAEYVKRNEELLAIEGIKAVIVFHDGECSGCSNLIVETRKRGIQLRVVYYED